ncbi:Prefoldin subunit 4 [Perkinsus olseni]|uniref:Prefoldin subunit 4 n=1 Tax=Perkinsus olseni TaxID=32597 RepID=A0A7J6T6S9_PEROL|nr:Prefoldin subunit 4 [Perkinsus olseni]
MVILIITLNNSCHGQPQQLRKSPLEESVLVKQAERRSKLVQEFPTLDGGGGAKSYRILTFNDILQILREDLFVSSRTVNDDDLKLVFRALLDSSHYERPGPRLDSTGRLTRAPEAVLVEELVGFIGKGDSESKANDENKKASKLMRVRRNVKLGIQQHLRRIRQQGLDTGHREEELTEEQLLRELFEKYDKDGGGELSMFEFTHAIRRDLQLNHWDISAEELRQTFSYIDADSSGEISIEEVLAFLRGKTDARRTEVAKTTRELLALRLGLYIGKGYSGPVHPFTAVPRGKRPAGRLAAAAAAGGGGGPQIRLDSWDPLLEIPKVDRDESGWNGEEHEGSRKSVQVAQPPSALKSSSLDRVNLIIEGVAEVGVDVAALLTMSTATAAASAAATGDIDVTMDDQLRINRFSRLNQTYEEMEEEMLQLKEKLKLCDSAVEEVELCMDDDGLMLSVGECFVPVDEDQALENVENKKDELSAEMDRLTQKSDAIQEEMRELKKVLYAKFGDTINLGAQCCLIGEDSDEDLMREWTRMAVEEWRALRTLRDVASACLAVEEVERARAARLEAVDKESRQRQAEVEDSLITMREARMEALEEEMRADQERMREELNEWCAEERTARMRSMQEDFERRTAELDEKLEDHKRALKERVADLDESQRRAIELLVKATPGRLPGT